MDETFAPAGGIDKRALRALSRYSNAKGLGHLAGHGAALGTTAWWLALATGSGWVFPAMVAHGIVLVFLFAPLHETIHWTAFRSRQLNDIVSWVCGAALALPPLYFRAFHFAHHRHTQDPDRDPELATPKPRDIGGYLWHVSGLQYWRAQALLLGRHAVGRVDAPFIARRHYPAIVREARVVLLVYLAIALGSAATGSWAALQYWVAPVLLGQPFLRMYLLAEHTGCPMIPDMLRNSRTTHTIWPVRFLAWNMPYHVEHHVFPALPFHALPAAHSLLKERIAVQATGYVAVQRGIVAGLGRAGTR